MRSDPGSAALKENALPLNHGGGGFRGNLGEATNIWVGVCVPPCERNDVIFR